MTRVLNRPGRWLAVIGVQVLALYALTASAGAPPLNDDPPNKPQAIVDAIIARDYQGLPRYSSGNLPYEYEPIFESYPPYDLVPITDSGTGKSNQMETPPTFGKCAQTMLVKNIKTTKVEAAPDMTSPPGKMRTNPWEAYVTVEAEVVALIIYKPDAIPPDQRCSWLGLEVKNTQTGKTEHYFDEVDNGDALLAMMKQFGQVHEVQFSRFKNKHLYVLVDPHRRQWSYGFSMILPSKGHGGKRHYDKKVRDYVQASEPRWLVQDPYPPAAWEYRRYIDSEKTKGIGHKQYMANQSCKLAIAQATGVAQVLEPDFKHPACQPGGGSPEIQQYFRDIEAQQGAIRFLEQIH